MESFKIPEEYQDFVSSPDMIKNNMLHPTYEENCIKYEIYTNNIENHNLLNDIENIVTNLTKDYLWYIDKFKLYSIKPGYYYGEVMFGDSIDDEWYVVYILFQLSLKFPDFNITTQDNDGQFLVIEAADYLPDWMEPHTSNNRVWIKSGLLKIITDNNSDNELDLNDALYILNNNSNGYLDTDKNTACNEIQQCLQQRISKYMNEDTRQEKHRCIITLPVSVWKLIQTIPDIITIACKMYIDRKNINSSIKTNKRVSKSQQRYIAEGEEGSDKADGVRRLVMRSDVITLSRMQYARLKYEENTKEEISDRLNGAMQTLRRVCDTTNKHHHLHHHDGNRNFVDLITLEKAIALGSKICIGLELAYFYSQREAKSLLLSPLLRSFADTVDQMLKPSSSFSPHVTMRDAFLDHDYVVSVDSEEWLTVTSEELDGKMQKQMGVNVNGKRSRNKNEDEDIKGLQDIMNDMKKMFGDHELDMNQDNCDDDHDDDNSSNNNSSNNSSSNNNSNNKADMMGDVWSDNMIESRLHQLMAKDVNAEDDHDGELQPLDFDSNKVYDILQSYCSLEELWEVESKQDYYTSIPTSASTSYGKSFLMTPASENGNGFVSRRNRDSNDESDTNDGSILNDTNSGETNNHEQLDQLSIDELMQAMDSEIMSNPVLESTYSSLPGHTYNPEKVDDEEYHMLSNLMMSHLAQNDPNNPASVFLGSLGNMNIPDVNMKMNTAKR